MKIITFTFVGNASKSAHRQTQVAMQIGTYAIVNNFMFTDIKPIIELW